MAVWWWCCWCHRHSFIFIIAMIFFATLLRCNMKFLAVSHSILFWVKRLCVCVSVFDPMHQRGGWWCDDDELKNQSLLNAHKTIHTRASIKREPMRRAALTLFAVVYIILISFHFTFVLFSREVFGVGASYPVHECSLWNGSIYTYEHSASIRMVCVYR